MSRRRCHHRLMPDLRMSCRMHHLVLIRDLVDRVRGSALLSQRRKGASRFETLARIARVAFAFMRPSRGSVKRC